ncbi:MAG: glycosyltransferase family 4 protein [Pyrinomonadaceae bacterium]|nr:glycosyltransferase family 4 protein [Pyrinomonadaceae bacterium]
MLQLQNFTPVAEVAESKAAILADNFIPRSKERIRVLRIAHASLTPALRGRERALARCFPDIDLEVVTPPRWREAEVEVETEPDEYFPVRTARTYLSKHIQLFLYDPRPIIEALKRHQPHIIDMNHEPYSVPCAEVLTLRRLYAPQAHIVMQTAQNIMKKYPFPFSVLEKRAFRQVSAAYMCSATVQEVLTDKGFQKPMEIVPFGVDLDMFKPVKRSPNETVTISYIGRLLPAKGLLVLIDALAQIKSENWKLLIVGDGPERKATEERIKEHGLEDRCEFVGAIPYDQTPFYFQKTDVLVVPTITTGKIREQFGRVIVEAMACNVPVIGSTCGAIPEVIADAGIVVPENNSNALAVQLRRVINDEELRNNLAAAGRKRVETHYTWERVAEQIHSVYSHVLNENRG